jgi:putative component of membrane protein insertase Oxa1/YidC/SpoIIIJ protein YidD
MQKLLVNFIIVLLFAVLVPGYIKATPPVPDNKLLAMKTPEEKLYIHRHDVKFMRTRSRNFLIRYNPVTLSLGGLMYVYQRIISPQLPSECFYSPSCSAFSKDLIHDFGVVKGVFFTSDRLMRCNRLSALDVHPLLVNEKSAKVVESTEIYKLNP